MINEQQAELLVKTAREEFRTIYGNEDDANVGIILIAELMGIFSSPYVIIDHNGYPKLICHKFPVGDKRFYEMLRVLANVLELAIVERDKNGNESVF